MDQNQAGLAVKKCWFNQHFLTAKLELSILCTIESLFGSISSHNENRQPKLPLLLSSLKQERPKPALFRMLSCGGEWGAEGNCRRSDVRRSFLGRRSNVPRRPWSLLVSNKRSTSEVVLGFKMVFVSASKLSVGPLIFYFSHYLWIFAAN